MSLKLEGVTMRYGRNPPVLDSLDLGISDGVSTAVMGPSGSGKTTLISVLGLLITPSAGTVLIDDRKAPEKEAARHRLRVRHFGWVLQTVNVLGRRSALENVSIPLLASGLGRDQATDVALDALSVVGLRGLANTQVRAMSGGERQRVCIARAMAHHPRFLLADEPTGQLDRATSDGVVEAMIELAEASGTTLVLVTHDPGLARRCNQTLRLLDGKVHVG